VPRQNSPPAGGDAAQAGIGNAEWRPDTTPASNAATRSTIAITRLTGNQPRQHQAKILRFHLFRNAADTMAGFFAAELPSGQIIHSLKLMRGPAGTLWVAMPDQKRRGPDDQLVLDDRGRPIYDAIIEFRDRDCRDRFCALLEALRRQYPEALDAGEAR
jgi:hypothetical protein